MNQSKATMQCKFFYLLLDVIIGEYLAIWISQTFEDLYENEVRIYKEEKKCHV